MSSAKRKHFKFTILIMFVYIQNLKHSAMYSAMYKYVICLFLQEALINLIKVALPNRNICIHRSKYEKKPLAISVSMPL